MISKMKLLESQNGAAMVEFAIALPLMLMLLFGGVEFGLVFYNKQVVDNASREGARAGIARQGNITGIVNGYCQNRLIDFGGSGTPTVTTTGVGGDFQDDLTVTVQYSYNFLIIPDILNVMGFSFPDPLTISATTVMKMEDMPPS